MSKVKLPRVFCFRYESDPHCSKVALNLAIYRNHLICSKLVLIPVLHFRVALLCEYISIIVEEPDSTVVLSTVCICLSQKEDFGNFPFSFCFYRDRATLVCVTIG